jgi:transcriptional regulator with XRE-family HTH domain
MAMAGNGDDGSRPLPRLLNDLRKQAGMTLEDVSFAIRDHGGRISAGAISQFERGAARPTPATIEYLAAALGVAPHAFAEYRLAQARAQIDERAVGLERALENLSVLEAALAALPEPAEALLEFQRFLDDDHRDTEQAKPRRSRTRGAAASAREPGAESSGGRSA